MGLRIESVSGKPDLPTLVILVIIVVIDTVLLLVRTPFSASDYGYIAKLLNGWVTYHVLMNGCWCHYGTRNCYLRNLMRLSIHVLHIIIMKTVNVRMQVFWYVSLASRPYRLCYYSGNMVSGKTRNMWVGYTHRSHCTVGIR